MGDIHRGNRLEEEGGERRGGGPGVVVRGGRGKGEARQKRGLTYGSRHYILSKAYCKGTRGIREKALTGCQSLAGQFFFATPIARLQLNVCGGGHVGTSVLVGKMR